MKQVPPMPKMKLRHEKYNEKKDVYYVASSDRSGEIITQFLLKEGAQGQLQNYIE